MIQDTLDWKQQQHQYLTDRLNARLRRRSDDKSLALMCLAFDQFSSIRAHYSAEVIDQLLREVRDRIQSFLRADDLVFVLGDSEFYILIDHVLNPGHLRLAYRRLYHEISQPFEIEGMMHIRPLFGAVMYPDGVKDAEHMISGVLKAVVLAASNDEGFYIYGQKDDDTSLKLDVSSELARALEEDELLLYFQPKVDLQSNTIAGAEALVRWQHPDLGFLTPNQFIPMAEQNEIINRFSRWCIHTALRERMNWAKEGVDIPVAVNIVSRNFRESSFQDIIHNAMSIWDTPPEKLVLEITEGTVMDNSDETRMLLEELRSVGVRIAIDDFGTGYSSLSYLKQLPVDELKIDQSFVRTMLESEKDRNIIEVSLKIAHDFGFKSVAEGLETIEQLKMLKELGCDVGQGYYFSRPLDSSQFIDWLKQ